MRTWKDDTGELLGLTFVVFLFTAPFVFMGWYAIGSDNPHEEIRVQAHYLTRGIEYAYESSEARSPIALVFGGQVYLNKAAVSFVDPGEFRALRRRADRGFD